MATSIINVHKSAKYTPCPLLIVVELRFSLINTIWHKSQSFLCLLQCGFYDVFPKYSTLLATCTSNSNTNMPLSYNQYGCYFKKKTENLQLRTKDRRLNNPIQWPHVCSHREYCKFGHKWHRRCASLWIFFECVGWGWLDCIPGCRLVTRWIRHPYSVVPFCWRGWSTYTLFARGSTLRVYTSSTWDRASAASRREYIHMQLSWISWRGIILASCHKTFRRG